MSPKKKDKVFSTEDYAQNRIWSSALDEEGVILTPKGDLKEYHSERFNRPYWGFLSDVRVEDGTQENEFCFSSKRLYRLFKDNMEALNGEELLIKKFGEGFSTQYTVEYA